MVRLSRNSAISCLSSKDSENQRTIDVQKSLEAGYVIEREGYES